LSKTVKQKEDEEEGGEGEEGKEIQEREKEEEKEEEEEKKEKKEKKEKRKREHKLPWLLVLAAGWLLPNGSQLGVEAGETAGVLFTLFTPADAIHNEW